MQGGKESFEATVTPVLAQVHTDEGIVGLGETILTILPVTRQGPQPSE